MTAPITAEKVCRGMPSQSAQVPYSRVSLIKTSPTSNQTARIGDMVGVSFLRGSVEGSELVVQDADWGGGVPRFEGGTEIAEPSGTGGVPGLVELVGSVRGDLAGVVDVAF